MPETIPNVPLAITIALFGLALLLSLLSVRLFRRSRTDVFWRRRREAGQRGWRVFVLAFVLLVLSGVSCIVTLATASTSGDDGDQPTAAALVDSTPPEPTQSPPTDADQPTPALPVPTATPVIIVVTTTPAYTPTETPFPTFTPPGPPLVSSVTPLPGAALRITALDDQLSAALEPVNPRTTFVAGTRRIYLFVEFQAMAHGVLWRRALYCDGILIDAGEYVWGLEPEGKTYFFFGRDDGFAPGSYEIRLFVGAGETAASIMPFTVLPPES